MVGPEGRKFGRSGTQDPKIQAILLTGVLKMKVSELPYKTYTLMVLNFAIREIFSRKRVSRVLNFAIASFWKFSRVLNFAIHLIGYFQKVGRKKEND